MHYLIPFSYNKNQQDALFTFHLFKKLTSTYFEQAIMLTDWLAGSGSCQPVNIKA
jgi:hypothetical protein